MGAIALRVLAAVAFMLVVAVAAFALSRGHVFVLPFILLLGTPLWFFRRR